MTSVSEGSGIPSGRRLRFGDGEPSQCRGAGRLLDVCRTRGLTGVCRACGLTSVCRTCGLTGVTSVELDWCRASGLTGTSAELYDARDPPPMNLGRRPPMSRCGGHVSSARCENAPPERQRTPPGRPGGVNYCERTTHPASTRARSGVREGANLTGVSYMETDPVLHCYPLRAPAYMYTRYH